MKRNSIVFSVAVALVVFFSLCTRQKIDKADEVKAFFAKELNLLQKKVRDSLLAEVKRGKDNKMMKTYFLNCRKQYKKIEFFAEYFYPPTARLVNGAPIAEIELGENMIDPPGGFQVIEGYLYGSLNAEERNRAIQEITAMQVSLKRMYALNEQFEITDAQVFDALRLEMFRITALGISAFDTPLSLNVTAETRSALDGIKEALAAYRNLPNELNNLFNTTNLYLKDKDFESLNQLDFITDFLQPLSVQLNNLREELKISAISSETVLNSHVVSLFQEGAFEVNSFLGNKTLFMSKEKVALGKLLFNDVVLSNGNNRSCASCHHEAKAFTDGLVSAKSQIKNKSLQRNTPTLTYAGYQNAFFYDLKASTLEDQALNVIHNAEEMKGSLTAAAKSINQKGNYDQYFAKAYPNDTIKATPFKIQNALASYVRSLAKFNSDFDHYMQGDKTKLTLTEKAGFNLFMGKGKCGACHFVPLFNGTAPPKFDRTEAEVLGVPFRPDTTNAKIDTDLGRFALSKYEQYRYAFKTPTLRNVSKTAPYMHNGTYQTLEQVMDFYNRGGGAGIGINLKNQTLSGEALNLTKKEIGAIIAFLKTLEDQ